MAGLELLSDQGYRLDGRKATELRKVQARMGVFGQADGSAYMEQGNTKALAVVYGPHEVHVHPPTLLLCNPDLDKRDKDTHYTVQTNECVLWLLYYIYRRTLQCQRSA